MTANVSEAEQRGLLDDEDEVGSASGGNGNDDDGDNEQEGAEVQKEKKAIRRQRQAKPVALLPHNKGTHTLFLDPSLLGVNVSKGPGALPSPSLSQSAPNSARLDPLKNHSSLYRLDGKGGDLDALALVRTTHAPRSLRNLQSVTAKCKYNSLCKGAVATRKCFSCIEYDPECEGLFCEACFRERHPWYRVKHRWCAIAEAVSLARKSTNPNRKHTRN